MSMINDEPPQQTLAAENAQSGGVDAKPTRGREAVRGRKGLTRFLLAMLPLSALVAFLVLAAMAAHSAAATGGCGGG